LSFERFELNYWLIKCDLSKYCISEVLLELLEWLNGDRNDWWDVDVRKEFGYIDDYMYMFRVCYDCACIF